MKHKSASVYFNQDFLFLCSESIHKRGLLYVTPPFIKINVHEASNEQLFTSLMSVLAASNEDSVFKKDLLFEKQLLGSFGFSSWRQFNNQTKLCRIRLKMPESTVELIPTEYDGRGYSNVPSLIKILRTTSEIDVFISALKDAMYLCK